MYVYIYMVMVIYGYVCFYLQECNVVECRHYNIYVGAWSECNRQCGQGNQTR
jgi:hypothetical protein